MIPKIVLFVLTVFLFLSSFLNFDDKGPESLGKKGHYTYKERLFYHKRYNINDLPFRYSKYVYSNVGMFLGTSPIFRRGSISELEKDLNSNIGSILMRTPLYGILSLDNFISQSSNQGYIVIHKGKIIYELYDKMNDYRYHLWMSVTKTLVGWIAHILEERKILDLSKTVADYLDEFKKAPYGKIKIKDLLNMSSGILGKDEYLEVMIYYFRFKKGVLNSDFFKNLKMLPAVEDPGKKFVYSTSNTIIITMIFERLLNQSISDFLTENLWGYIGAEHDASIGILGINAGNGKPLSGLAGFMSSTLRDLARYAMIYTPSWNKVSQKQLVSHKYFETLWQAENKPTLDEYWNLYTESKDFLTGDIGFGVNDIPRYGAYHWDMIFPDGDMMKTGYNSQGLYVSYKKDLIVTWFGYSGESPKPKEYSWVYARAIARYIMNGQINQYEKEYDPKYVSGLRWEY